MRKLYILFKILLSTAYGISSLKYKASKNIKEIIKPIVLLLVVVFSLLPMLIGYIVYMNLSYDSLATLGQGGVIITVGVVFASMLMIFFGFFYIVSTFYFTNDTEHLITLPLRPYQILGAKFGVVLVNEYMTALPIAIPPIVIYGIKGGQGLVYWIYALIGVIVIPLIPLCLTSIIAIVFMRVTNIGRKKDLFRIIGGIFAVLAMLGIQTYIQNAAVSGDPEKLKNLLFAENGLINFVARNFPPAAWISMALIEYQSIKGFMYLLLYLAVSIAFLAGFGYLGDKLFLGGYLGSQEVSAKGKKLDEAKLTKETGAKSKVFAVFLREFKILNRVPIFFFNCVFTVVLVPLIFLMMYFTSAGQLQELSAVIGSGQGPYIATIIIAGIGIFTGTTSMIAPTSISREGAEFFVSKYIPVSPKEQIIGKMLHALFIVLLGDVLTVLTLGILFPVPAVNLLISAGISALAIIPAVETGFIIDLYRPLLIWDNPQKAVKQNLNGVISIFFNSLWIGIIMFLSAWFIKNEMLSYTLLIVFFAAAGLILYRVLISYAGKRYMEIEL